MIDFIGNRASPLFERAVSEIDFGPDVLFTYWDTYYGPIPRLPGKPYGTIIEVLEKSWTNPIDNKGTLGEILWDLPSIFPRTYYGLEEIPEHRAQDESLWFVKEVHGAGGKGVSCHTYRELRSRGLSGTEILQEAVGNLELFEGRKFTIRAFVLIWRGELYLFRRWYQAVHGARYEEDSTDFSAQVSLRYEEGGTEFFSTDYRADPLQYSSLCSALEQLYEPLDFVLNESSRHKYILLGCDFLIQQDGQAKLIEINSYPNLMHKDVNVAHLVVYPMIKSAIELMVSEDQQALWQRL